MLSVSFKLDSALREALDFMREEEMPIRALIIVVCDEAMVLHGKPVEATASLDDDLTNIADYLKVNELEAAFIILKLDSGEFVQVSFCLEIAKPRVKMLYASGAAHLADASGLTNMTREHVVRIGDLVPSLFAKKTMSSLEDLMTDGEKQRAAIEKMELAPMPVAMPGVAMPLTEDAMVLLERFGRGELSAVTFVASADRISAEKSVDVVEASSSSIIDAVKSLIPVNQPRFVVLRCPAADAVMKMLMAYICPGACKPREKMMYASSKSSFLDQAKFHGISFARRLEVDNIDELVTAVVDALETNEEEKYVEPPLPTRPAVAKGPRMLI